MIIEVILVIIILYVYIIFRSSWRTENENTISTKKEADTEDSDSDAPVALSTSPIPVATTTVESPSAEIKITKETPEKIVITPACFEPVPPPNLDKIPLPSNYDPMSKTDRDQVKCLAYYRSMTNEKPLDFRRSPFQGDIEDRETLVLLLDQIVTLHGIHLGFNRFQHIYDDSDYRTIQHNKDLGSIHSIITSGNDLTTAKFQFSLDFKYAVITQTTSTVKEFILRFINAIANLIQCDPKLIRVFAITNDTLGNNNTIVNFDITTRSTNRTRTLADQLENKVATKSALHPEKYDILRHIIPNQDGYKLEPALVHLQLQKSDFDCKYNRFYPQDHPLKCRRGGRSYYFPISWYRHALKVEDKYPHDKLWLGDTNVPGEWSVAYHGTRDIAVKDIVQEGLSQGKVKADYYRQEAIEKAGSKADVKGIYLATHCEGGASKYARSFSVKNDAGKETKYQMVFQCRVEPGKYTEHTGPAVDVGTILRVFDEKAIRPYGILLKEEKDPDGILMKVVKAPINSCTQS